MTTTTYDPTISDDELETLHRLLQKMVADPSIPKRHYVDTGGRRETRTHLQGLLDALIAVDHEIAERGKDDDECP